MNFGSNYLLLEPAPPPVKPQQQQQQYTSTPIAELKALPPVQAPAKRPPRRDMLKLVIYAMVILFALAIYSAVEMIIKELAVSGDLSFKQELGIRLLYPVLLFFGLWFIKF